MGASSTVALGLKYTAIFADLPQIVGQSHSLNFLICVVEQIEGDVGRWPYLQLFFEDSVHEMCHVEFPLSSVPEMMTP